MTKNHGVRFKLGSEKMADCIFLISEKCFVQFSANSHDTVGERERRGLRGSAVAEFIELAV